MFKSLWREQRDLEEKFEHERLRLEKKLKTAIDAIELITSTADCVLAKNTPEFMTYLAEQIEEAEKTWAELGGKDKE